MLKANKVVRQWCFFFHHSLANSMTNWAQIFTGLVFYACWDTPSELYWSSTITKLVQCLFEKARLKLRRFQTPASHTHSLSLSECLSFTPTYRVLGQAEAQTGTRGFPVDSSWYITGITDFQKRGQKILIISRAVVREPEHTNTCAFILPSQTRVWLNNKRMPQADCNSGLSLNFVFLKYWHLFMKLSARKKNYIHINSMLHKRRW